NPAGTLQIDTLPTTISAIRDTGIGITSGTGDLNASHVVTITVNMSEVVTVAGGVPTLTLNDGGTATYQSGSGINALVFSYTVASVHTTRLLISNHFTNKNTATTQTANHAHTDTVPVANPAGTL